MGFSGAVSVAPSELFTQENQMKKELTTEKVWVTNTGDRVRKAVRQKMLGHVLVVRVKDGRSFFLKPDQLSEPD